MKDGGYDIGYKQCNCFWGNKPGSLIKKINKYIDSFNGKRVLDLGCGEGKNAFYLASKGCRIDAYDISSYAINNGLNLINGYVNIEFKIADVLNLKFENEIYDIVIAYGLYHCFKNKKEVEKQINASLFALKK